MSSPLDRIKENVRAIKAYTLDPLEAPIKINQVTPVTLAAEPLTDKVTWQNGNRYTYRLRPSTYMQAAMLVPEAATQRHLEILSEIAELLSDRELREKLKTAADAATVHRLIADWEPLKSVA